MTIKTPNLTFFVLSICFMISYVPDAFAQREDAPQTSISSGIIEGIIDGNVVSYKGIPYAKPPVGELRWTPPQKIDPWQGVKDAKNFGSDCQQKPIEGDAAPLGGTLSENCLFLNIWHPDNYTEDLPVLVWIHGGGFTNGGTSSPIFDGSKFAEKGIVVVSMNYRLGRFGFFAHPALTKSEDPPYGNYGYMDQQAALRWVKTNISNFGGDQDRITIMGESAGGQSVLDHLTMEPSNGLYHQAIVMSGGGRTLLGGFPLQDGDRRWPDAEEIGLNYAKGEKIRPNSQNALEELRSLTAEDIVRDENMVTLLITAILPTGPLQFVRGPIIDGELIRGQQDELYKKRDFNPVPMMIGTTGGDLGTWIPLSKRKFFDSFGDEKNLAKKLYDPTGDGNLFSVVLPAAADRTMHEPARFIARNITDAGQQVYRYRFSYVADSLRAESPQAGHASELPFLFGSLNSRLGDNSTKKDESVSENFQNYVVNFVKTGNPNGDDLTEWLPEQQSTDELMIFNDQGKAVFQKDPLSDRLDLMSRVADNEPRPIGIAELEKPDWTGFVALGALNTPTHPGSNQTFTTPVPMAEVTYRNTIFASIATTGRSFALGWHAYDNRVWRISVNAGLSDKRIESESDALAGMGDRGIGINSGLNITRRSGLVSKSLDIKQGLNDGAGTSATLGTSLMLPFSLSSALTAGVNAKFASAKQMDYEFGISQPQAQQRLALIDNNDPRLRSGDAITYNPSGGIQSMGANLAYIKVFSDRWLLAFFGSYSYLLGPGADSPLVRQNSNFTLGLGMGWKF